MNAEIKSMRLVNESATHLLIQQMGIVDTTRFFNQFSTGQGNYTEERREMVEALTLDDIFSAIEKSECQTSAK